MASPYPVEALAAWKPALGVQWHTHVLRRTRLEAQTMKITSTCLVFVACLTASVCQAQFGVPWRHMPTVVVVGSEGDARNLLVDEAISFWNQSLQDLGSGFRLPAATHVVQAPPEQALQALSHSVLGRRTGSVGIPPELHALPGELTIVLGNSDFISFASPFFGSGPRRIIGIRSMNLLPTSLPNVARNVIIHELGHAIGLGHNSDPSMLMCGRPASCRPGLFQSPVPRVFPLADDEKRQLVSMYPAQWKPGSQ